MIEFRGVSLPEPPDLPALPRRVVLHWTGGGHRANGVDLGAYHAVVESDGTVRMGRHSVAENMRPLRHGDGYAAHSGGANSFAVGLAAAGMAGYRGPADVGKYPLTEVQIDRLCELAGYFCRLAGLNPRNPAHLCTHQELWTIHRIRGKRNHQKADIEYLPFRPHLTPREVGDYLRALTALFTARPDAPSVSVPAKPLLPEQPDVPAADVL